MADLARAAFLCPACNKLLREPKTLSCKHTFCKTCLQVHCVDTAMYDSFKCPSCSAVVKVKDPNMPLFEWADSIPTNKHMGNPLEKLWRIEEEERHYKCILCLQRWKVVRAEKYCKACAEYFCDECGNQHWLLRSSKEHRMWMIEDLAKLQKDPFVRARLDLIFSAKYRGQKPRTERRPSIFEKNHIVTHEDKVKETEQYDITGVCFLGKTIVLADQGNAQLTLVDEHHVVQTVYKTPCFDVVGLNQYYIVITCPGDKCFKILSVYDCVIDEDRKISVDTECYGLCQMGEHFAVGLAGRPPSVRVYSGSVLKDEIKLDHGKVTLKQPRYIVFHDKTERLYISDSTSRALKCFTRSGEIVWEKSIECCNGVSLFGSYLIVARSDRDSVDLVSGAGRILKSVVRPEAGLRDVRVLRVEDGGTEPDGSRRLMAVDAAAHLVHMFVLYDPMDDDDLKSYVDRTSGIKLPEHQQQDDDTNNEKATRICVLL